MQLAVTFRHMDATNPLKEYAKEKVERIRKYFPDPISAHVTLTTERGYQHAVDVLIQLHNGLTIKVIAHQWWWEFQYPEYGIDTADEVHLQAGRMVHFAMESADIIHSFWVPTLGGKRDVVPGQINSITYTPDQLGMFYGQCVEFCGDSHANMRLRAFVQTKDDFDKWVKQQQSPPVTPAGGSATAGAQIFANAPCAICHTVKGLTGLSPQYSGTFKGPDLTHFGSRSTLAGSILENTPENLAKWIQDPDKVKPGANMPTLGLKGKDLNDLVAYLESLK